MYDQLKRVTGACGGGRTREGGRTRGWLDAWVCAPVVCTEVRRSARAAHIFVDRLPGCPAAAAAGYRQGIVLPAFETIDDGEEGKTAALKAIKGGSPDWAAGGLCGGEGHWLLCRHQSVVAVVLPLISDAAFQLSPNRCRHCFTARTRAGRDALKELFNRGELRGFHMDHYNRGHRCAGVLGVVGCWVLGCWVLEWWGGWGRGVGWVGSVGCGG